VCQSSVEKAVVRYRTDNIQFRWYFSAVMSGSALYCSICSQLIALEESRTDGEGNAVHEFCYVLLIVEQSRTQVPSKPSE
jgi:hypothetical protein